MTRRIRIRVRTSKLRPHPKVSRPRHLLQDFSTWTSMRIHPKMSTTECHEDCRGPCNINGQNSGKGGLWHSGCLRTRSPAVVHNPCMPALALGPSTLLKPPNRSIFTLSFYQGTHRILRWMHDHNFHPSFADYDNPSTARPLRFSSQLRPFYHDDFSARTRQ